MSFKFLDKRNWGSGGTNSGFQVSYSNTLNFVVHCQPLLCDLLKLDLHGYFTCAISDFFNMNKFSSNSRVWLIITEDINLIGENIFHWLVFYSLGTPKTLNKYWLHWWKEIVYECKIFKTNQTHSLHIENRQLNLWLKFKRRFRQTKYKRKIHFPLKHIEHSLIYLVICSTNTCQVLTVS